MAEPPVFVGAVHERETCALPAVGVRPVGGSGTVIGVVLFEAADAAPIPTELVAVTVNVYDVPFVRPVTVIGDDAPVAVNPPGFEVTV